MNKIGLYCGTFDPIHFGHINLALEAFEKKKLDKVLFCPSNISPKKVNNPPKASGQDRLAMLKLALDDLPCFEICDVEIARGGISYTVDTVREIKGLYPGDELRLIIAADSFPGFSSWKNCSDILEKAPPIVGLRKGFDRPPVEFDVMNNKVLEISSSDIRSRLKKNLYSAHLLHIKVLDYIYKHGLY